MNMARLLGDYVYLDWDNYANNNSFHVNQQRGGGFDPQVFNNYCRVI